MHPNFTYFPVVFENVCYHRLCFVKFSCDICEILFKSMMFYIFFLWYLWNSVKKQQIVPIFPVIFVIFGCFPKLLAVYNRYCNNSGHRLCPIHNFIYFSCDVCKILLTSIVCCLFFLWYLWNSVQIDVVLFIFPVIFVIFCFKPTDFIYFPVIFVILGCFPELSGVYNRYNAIVQENTQNITNITGKIDKICWFEAKNHKYHMKNI